MSEWENERQKDASGPPASKGDQGGWERDLLHKLAFAALKEQRRARRWGIFFKLLLFVYLFALLFLFTRDWQGGSAIPVGKHTALVEISGVIADDAVSNADSVITGLRAAFEDKRTAGVIVRINSPGGSPVQAGYIYDEIKRLREKHPDIPLYAVITDICASGGYYVAAAADEIYADKASLVGSIGVLMDGFGFVEAIKKLGIERRLLAAGEHKGFLDPFSPAREDDVKHMQALLETVHRQFMEAVKKGRGERLKDDPKIFSGLIWTGEESVALGLVDGLGSSSFVAREIIGAERIVDYTPRPDFFERFARQVGVSLARAWAHLYGAESGVKLR